MEKISLLPPEIKARRQSMRKLRRLSQLLYLVLLIVVVVNVFFLVTNHLVNQNLQSIKSEREAVESEAAALQEYQDLYEELRAAENSLAGAMGTVPLFSEIFQDVSRTMPPSAWLSDLTVSYSAQSGTLDLSGWAHDYRRLAETLEQLHTLEQLDQVRTRTTANVEYDGRAAIQFQVDAELLTGPEFIENHDTDVEVDDNDIDNDQGGE